MANRVQEAIDVLVDTVRSEEREAIRTRMMGVFGVQSRTEKPIPDPTTNATRVLAFIRSHPGCKGEEINAACGFEGAQLVAVRHKLGKAIRTKGRRRGMRYYVKEGR